MGISQNCNDLSVVYRYKKDYQKALNYIIECIEITKKYLNNKDLETAYGNLSLIYDEMGNKKESISALKKALEISEGNGHISTQIGCYINLASVLLQTGDAKEGMSYLEKAIVLAQKMGYKDALCEAYLGMSELYTSVSDYRSAFLYHKKYSLLKDTLLNEENNKQIVELQTLYETEIKDKELIKKDAEISIQTAGAKRKLFQRNIFIVCFALMIGLALFIYRSYRLKKLANSKLHKQKELIEEKQKEILDSIYYASRIQRALITSEKYIHRNLSRLIKN